MRANEGQRRPTKGKTQVNKGPQRPTTANDSQPRPTQADKGPQQPMMANEGQRRPTKTKRGPNDASGVVWAIICFFSNVQSSCYFFITSRSSCSCFFSNKPRSEPEPGLGPPWALYWGPQQYYLSPHPYQAEPKPGFLSRAGPCTSLQTRRLGL